MTGVDLGLTVESGSTDPPLALGLTVLTGTVGVSLDVLGIPRLAVAGEIHVEVAEQRPDIEVELFDPTDPDVVIGDLSDAFNRSFSDVFNGEGRASFEVLRDDPIVPEIHSPRLLRFKYKGRYAFLAALNSEHQQTLASVSGNSGESPEEAAETKQFTCTEALHMWHKCAVLPTRWFNAGPDPKPKEQDRQFNAGWNVVDHGSWPHAIALQRQGDPAPIPAPYGWDAQPPSFPDPDAHWIAAPGCTAGGAPANAIMHVYRDMVVGTIGGMGVTSCRLYYGADDALTTFLDAQQIAESLEAGSRLSLRYIDFDLSDGAHSLYFVVKNGPGTGLAYNPMGLVWTLQELVNGVPSGVLHDGVTGQPLHSSDVDVTLLNPIAQPGVTAGMVLLALDFDRIARGIQTWWDQDYTVHHDSAGQPWPTLPNFVLHVGTDHAEAVRTLIQSGVVDIKVDPYRSLVHAYVGGTYGSYSGVSFPPPVEGVDQSLAELTHDTAEPRATHLLVEYQTGRVLVEMDGFDAMTMERIEGTLDLGKEPDAATATLWAKKLLARSSVNYDAVAAGWDPADPTHDPYVNPRLIPGSFVDVCNATVDDVRRQQFAGVTITEDENGVAAVTPELNDLALFDEQLIRQWLERSAPGQMGGIYPIGQTPVPVASTAQTARTPALNWSLGDVPGTPIETDVHVRCQLRELIVSRFSGSAATPSTSGTSVVYVYYDNVFAGAATIVAGQSKKRITLGNQVVTPNVNRVTCLLQTSSGARHTAQVRTEAAP